MDWLVKQPRQIKGDAGRKGLCVLAKIFGLNAATVERERQ